MRGVDRLERRWVQLRHPHWQDPPRRPRVFKQQARARRYLRRPMQHHRRDGRRRRAVHPAVTASASVAAPDLAGAAPEASRQRNRRRG